MNRLTKSSLATILFGLLSMSIACQPSDEFDCEGGLCEDPNSQANSVCQTEAAEICQDIFLGNVKVSSEHEQDVALFSSLQECAKATFQACRDEVAKEYHCDARRADSLQCSSSSLGSSFIPGALRWAAQDVNCVTSGSGLNKIPCTLPSFDNPFVDENKDGRGRTRGELNDGRFDKAAGFNPAEEGEGSSTGGADDRGQEYTEYFAVVQMPGDKEPIIVGQNGIGTQGAQNGDHAIPVTNSDLRKLNAKPIGGGQKGDAVFGQCIFTSWHQDNVRPLEINNGLSAPPKDLRLASLEDAGAYSNDEYNLAVDSGKFRMEIGINSNGAAADLVDNCSKNVAQLEDAFQLDPPARLSMNHDDTFDRGCMRTYELFTTEWRRSDPTICAVPMHLEECGCSLEITAGNESFKLPVGHEVESDVGRQTARSVSVISRLLVPDQFDQDGESTDFYTQLGQTVGAASPQIAAALAGMGKGASRFFLRGFALGGWNDSTKGTALIGQGLTGTPYQMRAFQCIEDGGTPEAIPGGSSAPFGEEDMVHCRVNTWGTKHSLEALTPPAGCRFEQIALKGCNYAPVEKDNAGEWQLVDPTQCSQANNGMGEHGRNILSCDLTINKISTLFSPKTAFRDMKSVCQAMYGNEAVVHIPYQASHIPEATLSCNPQPGMEEACSFIMQDPANAAQVIDVESDGVCNRTEADEVQVREPLPDEVLETGDRNDDINSEDGRRRARDAEGENPTTPACEVVCVKGKACGDRCINKNHTCKPNDDGSPKIGKACNGDTMAPVAAN